MKKALTMLLMMALLSTFGMASAVDTSASPWAKDSLEQAITLGFVPEELQTAYTQDITRGEFALVAVQFAAMQLQCSTDELYQTLEAEFLEKQGAESTHFTSPFTDTQEPYALCAYYLGIVQGRGDGTFDPDGPITRQEAAAMLCRSFTAYGGVLESDGATQSFSDTFSDAGDVAAWALESVDVMWEWGVMGGIGEDLFSPLGTYTREMCIVTFLRLSENAPAVPLDAVPAE